MYRGRPFTVSSHEVTRPDWPHTGIRVDVLLRVVVAVPSGAVPDAAGAAQSMGQSTHWWYRAAAASCRGIDIGRERTVELGAGKRAGPNCAQSLQGI